MSKQLTTDDFYNEINHAATVAAPLFNMYGWTWGLEDGGIGIPTHNDIVNTLERLVEDALERFNNSREEYPEAGISTGRFEVRVKQYEDEQQLSIDLNLASKSRYQEFTF